MRFKNFTLLFLMGIFGLFSTNLFAQQDATIDPADIRWWVGEGENEVVVAINWCSYTETALAWGYRFNGEATVFQALTDIAAADSRLTVVGSAPTNITYVDDEYNLTMCPNPNAQYGDDDYDIPMHSVNGLMGQYMMAEEPIQNNDFVKIGGYACGVMSSDWTTISWSTEIIPAIDPNAGEEAVDATISADEIKYWIGEGENEVIFIVNWNEPDTALAWGYRFSEEAITVKDLMFNIQSVDYRFSFEGDSYVTEITFNDGVLDLSLSGMWWMYNVNGVTASEYFNNQVIRDGDWVKWGDESCGVLVDPSNYIYVWEKEVAPVYPLAEEAMIDASEILYWIGEGQNEVIFAVNWNEPNKCFAWGYRFEDEMITLNKVMEGIAAADARFNYVEGDWGIDDITFDEGDLHLSLAGQWWLYNVNGVMGWYGYQEEPLYNGYFVKWGDESCATEVAQWAYVWTQPVEPVSVYDAVNENMASTLSVYPNPAVNETFVTMASAGLNEISVYDIQGRLISKESINAMAGEKVRVSTEMLNVGVYFISVTSDDAVRTAKLVVK